MHPIAMRRLCRDTRVQNPGVRSEVSRGPGRETAWYRDTPGLDADGNDLGRQEAVPSVFAMGNLVESWRLV